MHQEQQNVIDELKQLVSFLESHEFDLEDGKHYFSNPELYLFTNTGDGFIKNVRNLGGFKREFNDYAANAVKQFGSTKLVVHSSRGSVCEKIKVGVKVVPAVPERIIPAQEERIEEVYEYKCPESLLAKGVEVGAGT